MGHGGEWGKAVRRVWWLVGRGGRWGTITSTLTKKVVFVYILQSDYDAIILVTHFLLNSIVIDKFWLLWISLPYPIEERKYFIYQLVRFLVSIVTGKLLTLSDTFIVLRQITQNIYLYIIM